MSEQPIQKSEGTGAPSEPAAFQAPQGEEGRIPRLFGEMPQALEASGLIEAAAQAAAPADAESSEGDEVSPAGRVEAVRVRRAASRSRAYRKPQGSSRAGFTSAQKLLILDAWQRSGLAGTDFAPLVGASVHTLYAWRGAFEREGPAGLEARPKGAPAGSRLAEPTRRAILMMKQAHPEWGCERLHDMLVRTQGLSASAGAIAYLLKQEGYEVAEQPTSPHPPQVKRFERARPNQLWQTDLFTFVLKRQNRRVWLVAFMDDHSRFVVGYGLHASASGALVREVLEAAIANFGAPEEVLTDNGTQYHTWRGVSAFSQLLGRRGIKHIVASPRHPQTLGKVERFWGTLWRECAEAAIFEDLTDARRRIGLFIDHYNFQRTHSGIEGLVPADRYFASAPQVLATLKGRVAANAADLARHGQPRQSFYLTGRVGEQVLALHAEGSRVILTTGEGARQEVELAAPGKRAMPGEDVELPAALAVEGRVSAAAAAEEASPASPGTSGLDEAVERLEAAQVTGAGGCDEVTR